VATFAGGCFWCVEPAFAQLPGISSMVVGYTGGSTVNPTYYSVAAGGTGHVEALQVEFDPTVISYQQLLQTFWRQIDPTDSGGQFADRGNEYQTAIFYHSLEQKNLAEVSKKDLDKAKVFPGPIVTKILPASEFYPAEDFHQRYAEKNPIGYNLYAYGSGRKGYLKKIWSAEQKKSA
jgi:peptide methionine sulfoxide reductase msrA/msrB